MANSEEINIINNIICRIDFYINLYNEKLKPNIKKNEHYKYINIIYKIINLKYDLLFIKNNLNINNKLIYDTILNNIKNNDEINIINLSQKQDKEYNIYSSDLKDIINNEKNDNKNILILNRIIKYFNELFKNIYNLQQKTIKNIKNVLYINIPKKNIKPNNKNFIKLNKDDEIKEYKKYNDKYGLNLEM